MSNLKDRVAHSGEGCRRSGAICTPVSNRCHLQLLIESWTRLMYGRQQGVVTRPGPARFLHDRHVIRKLYHPRHSPPKTLPLHHIQQTSVDNVCGQVADDLSPILLAAVTTVVLSVLILAAVMAWRRWARPVCQAHVTRAHLPSPIAIPQKGRHGRQQVRKSHELRALEFSHEVRPVIDAPKSLFEALGQMPVTERDAKELSSPSALGQIQPTLLINSFTADSEDVFNTAILERDDSMPSYVFSEPLVEDREMYSHLGDIPADPGALTDTFYTSSEVVTVQVIPGDGDCMFAALAHQLFRVPVRSPQHTRNTAMLRAESVAYLRQHIAMFRDVLLDGVEGLGAHYRDELTDDDKIQRFLDDLAMPGFWGGGECLAALANLMLMDIVIYLEQASMHSIKNMTDAVARVARIAYRLSLVGDGVYNHYDSVLSVRPIAQSSIGTGFSQGDVSNALVREVALLDHSLRFPSKPETKSNESELPVSRQLLQSAARRHKTPAGMLRWPWNRLQRRAICMQTVDWDKSLKYAARQLLKNYSLRGVESGCFEGLHAFNCILYLVGMRGVRFGQCEMMMAHLEVPINLSHKCEICWKDIELES
ncbi:hypothetical protein PR048_026815 [Dryococelus australis]|uniref:OTU domain-containing protein n=1 Tax=Dryococelus australis TaxID=614101 RepID=A0ABQ9GMD0_9NEOP|nr:hypothetical protein PR048_026815 [Dryococelus australis]